MKKKGGEQSNYCGTKSTQKKEAAVNLGDLSMEDRQAGRGGSGPSYTAAILTVALLPPAKRLTVHADTGLAGIGAGDLRMNRNHLIRLIYWLMLLFFAQPNARSCAFNLRMCISCSLRRVRGSGSTADITSNSPL